MIKKDPLILFFVFIITGIFFLPLKGVAMGDRPDYKTQIKEKFKKIDLSDGVNKEEAIIIAQNHLIESDWGRGCNLKSAKIFAENDPYWDKNSWHVEFNLKFMEKIKSGLKWITISIDKITGKVSGGGAGPS